MMRGVRNGWLEHDPYDEVARRGWIALTRVVGKSGTVYRSAVDCEPPGDSGQYLNAPVQNGEFIGQACALWCVNQFLESSERTESPDPPTARIH
jgi:hypothetical protein